MRAVVVREHGGLDALVHEELPDPEAKKGQVAVRVRTVGVNHLDLWVRRGVPGHRFPLPLIPGNDVAGIVDSVGPGVTGIEIGSEVVVAPGVSCGECIACQNERDHQCRQYGILGETRDGGYAEIIIVPKENLIPKPTSLSFETAAAIGIPFLTAWHMLVDRAELKQGERVLVQAGGSGVGVAAIRIAALFDAKIITTVGSSGKVKKAEELGVAHVINYREQEVAKEVKRITDGRGVDVVIDHIGADSWEGSLRALAWHGRLVTCGATTGAEVKLNLRHLFFKSQSLLGSTMGSLGEMRRVVELVANGRLEPVIDRVLPLDRVKEAHRLLEARELFGKIILTL